MALPPTPSLSPLSSPPLDCPLPPSTLSSLSPPLSLPFPPLHSRPQRQWLQAGATLEEEEELSSPPHCKQCGRGGRHREESSGGKGGRWVLGATLRSMPTWSLHVRCLMKCLREISDAKDLDDQLVTALGQRILELASKLEVFVLKLVPTSELKKSLALAQEAAGVSDYASGTNALILSERFCCPFPNCSALLDPSQLFASASCSGPVNSNSVECSACGRLVCISCHVPWHASMTCEEYQNNPQEERDSEDAALHHLAQENNWRRCERCLRVIDFVQGCYHMTCRCGHEFCYSCGSDYIGGQQACHCAHHEEEGEEQQVTLSNQDSELWRWDSFELPTSALDAYTEQERSQLALIQRFLAGGLGLSDLNPCQSPPRCSDSFVDTIKDLHQLPWLERFVSVISDNYHEDYIQ